MITEPLKKAPSPSHFFGSKTMSIWNNTFIKLFSNSIIFFEYVERTIKQMAWSTINEGNFLY